MVLAGWWQRLWSDRKNQKGFAAKHNKFQTLQPGDLVVVELNRELLRGISLTTETSFAAKLPENLTHIKGFVKRVNQVRPQGNSTAPTISVLELLTAIRFDQLADSATRLELSILEHETKSVSRVG